MFSQFIAAPLSLIVPLPLLNYLSPSCPCHPSNSFGSAPHLCFIPSLPLLLLKTSSWIPFIVGPLLVRTTLRAELNYYFLLSTLCPPLFFSSSLGSRERTCVFILSVSGFAPVIAIQNHALSISSVAGSRQPASFASSSCPTRPLTLLRQRPTYQALLHT